MPKMAHLYSDNMKWQFYVLVVSSASLWGRVWCGSAPPKNPNTVEAQAKFFQDFFSVQLSPHNIEFGHVCEDPNTWEQRYEKKDYKNHRDMGKVRWGDKHGGYGEHYWDLNHAGNSGSHDDGGSDDGSYHEDEGSYNGDDGSYREDDNSLNQDTYDEPSEQAPNYAAAENQHNLEEVGRAKRAHPRVKERRHHGYMNHEEPKHVKKQKHESSEEDEEDRETERDSDPENYQPPQQYHKEHQPPRHHHQQQNHKRNHKPKYQERQPEVPEEQKKQVVLVVEENEKPPKPSPVLSAPEPTQFVSYQAAGVRNYQPGASPSVPRLYFEQATGHVVDRATGQAYVLQPIAFSNNYK